MKPIVISPEAGEELDETVDFYDQQQLGLGERFYRTVRDAMRKIQENPSTGHLSSKGTRTLRVDRFPFGVVFRERPDDLLIIAVCHFSRRENHWADRIEDEESR